LQWVIVALVKALDVVAIEALVTDLHPGTQRAHGRKFLDSEPDRLRCGRKAAIAQRLSCPALALAHEQLGGYAVVESHSLAVGRFCVHVEFYHGNRPERIVAGRDQGQGIASAFGTPVHWGCNDSVVADYRRIPSGSRVGETSGSRAVVVSPR
jgi:hypothetical protein